jgi:uncharacterized phage protein gp47/JayE
MPFSRPSLKDIVTRIGSDIQSRLPGTDPKLRHSILGILARVFSGAVHGLYGYLDYLAKQLMPDTATGIWLERWARIWSIFRKAAVPAQGNIDCTGTNGALIPQGSTLQRSDGTEYTTDADATIVAGTATVAVTASTGGADTNTAAASTLTFSAPIAGINSTATVDGTGLIGGVDTESDDDLRSRLLSRIQQPPQGGAAHDYVAWALEVAGVTRAWCYPIENGAGTVVVRFMMDDAYVDGIPLAGDVTEVQNYIDARRPVGLALNGFTAVAPVAVPLDFTISVAPDTQAVRDAVEAELADMIRRDAEPGGTIRLSRIHEAISLADGETDHVLTAPAADVPHTTNQIATMGTVTWS